MITSKIATPSAETINAVQKAYLTSVKNYEKSAVNLVDVMLGKSFGNYVANFTDCLKNSQDKTIAYERLHKALKDYGTFFDEITPALIDGFKVFISDFHVTSQVYLIVRGANGWLKWLWAKADSYKANDACTLINSITFDNADESPCGDLSALNDLNFELAVRYDISNNQLNSRRYDIIINGEYFPIIDNLSD